MMMSYIGINPDEYPLERYTGDDRPSIHTFDYESMFNDPLKQEMVMLDDQLRDPVKIWDTLIVSTLQATAALYCD